MIRFQNVAKTFRKKRALDGVTFDVPSGAIYALVGPNGAGKSTALSVSLNVIRPDAGAVEILGVDSTRLAPRDFQSIGYISENQMLPESMRVRDFLRYCRGFYDAWDDQLASSLTSSFAIPMDRRLRQLSRGENIRLALVSSLAYRPKLLVMDEPFSGLDVLVRDELIETMLGLAEGMTVLLASHDLADLESFATHVAYIDNGKLWFAEEMVSLSARFREVEVTLDESPPALSGVPTHWLSVESTGRVVRFVDSAWNPERSAAAIRAALPGTRDVQARDISLRAMFVALAKTTRANRAQGARA